MEERPVNVVTGQARFRGRTAARDHRRHLVAAKQVCSGCPVLEQCKAWALQDPDPVPRWVAGGLTTAERDAVRFR